jgi:diguanylate cyclase (GGDEF)-like protein
MAVAAAVDAVVLLGLGTNGVRPAIALDLAIVGAAILSLWLIPRSHGHVAEVAAFAVTIAVGTSTVVTGFTAPSLAAQTVGYLVLLPVLIALVLPWRTIVHLRWLLCYTVVAAVYFIVGPGARFSPAERGDLLVVLIIAVGASVAGNLLLQHGHIRAFAQLERIRSLQRRAEADHRELSRIHRELERTARIDPLTGAGNRRRLIEDLRTVRANIDRSGAVYGLLELDLDHFKGINDRLGHLAGDDVLVRVVEAVQTAMRATDGLYRYGGEEFVVILAVTDRDQVLAAAERVRTAVLDLRIENPTNDQHGVVSVSIGATLLGDATLALTDEEWFLVVDRALYDAKEGGRNQVRFKTGVAA